MATVIRILAGLLLVAHGLVHLIFLASDISEFTLERSWVLPEGSDRTVGLALLASAIGAFSLAGLAVWGVPGLASIWPTLTVIGAATSLLLLLAFWNLQMIYGVAINLTLIIVAVLQPGWTQRFG